jgi:hypothetical protein
MTTCQNSASLAEPLCSGTRIHPAPVSGIEVPAAYLRDESDEGFRRRLLGNPQPASLAIEPISSGGRTGYGTAQTGCDVLFRGFDDAVAFRVVFDRKYKKRLTGELCVMDVLLAVFLWLEPVEATLLAVSHVSRAWRQASAYLPQWCVTYELLHPNAMLTFVTTRSELDAACRAARTDTPTVLGFDVRKRSDYLATMRVRPIVCEHILRRRSVVHDCCERWVCLITFIVAAGVLALVLYGCFEIGFRFGGDALVVVKALLLSIGAPVVLLACLRCSCAATMRERTVSVAVVAAMVSVMLGGPVAGAAARIAQAAAQREAPRIVYSTAMCTDPSRFAFEERPMYVQLENPWEWSIEPWPADGPAAVALRLCKVPPLDLALRTWWADTYFGNPVILDALQREFNATFAQANGIQCSDLLVTSQMNRYDFLMLYPPAKLVAACPTVTPLALAYDPTRKDFNATVRALWSVSADGAGAAPSGSLTSFRTAVETTWFNVEWAHEAGAAWFAASEAALNGTDVPLRYSKAYLWQSRRIPLVVPVVASSPEDLEASWWVRVRAFFGTAAAFMGMLLLLLWCFNEVGRACIGLPVLIILFVSAVVLPLCFV